MASASSSTTSSRGGPSLIPPATARKSMLGEAPPDDAEYAKLLKGFDLETRFETPATTLDFLWGAALAGAKKDNALYTNFRKYLIERVAWMAVEASSENPPQSMAFHAQRHALALEALGDSGMSHALSVVNHVNELMNGLRSKYRPLDNIPMAERLENMIVSKGTELTKDGGPCPPMMELCNLQTLEEVGACGYPGDEPWSVLPGAWCFIKNASATSRSRNRGSFKNAAELKQRLDEVMAESTDLMIKYPRFKKEFQDALTNFGEQNSRLGIVQFDSADVALAAKAINFMYENAQSILELARKDIIATLEHAIKKNDRGEPLTDAANGTLQGVQKVVVERKESSAADAKVLKKEEEDASKLPFQVESGTFQKLETTVAARGKMDNKSALVQAVYRFYPRNADILALLCEITFALIETGANTPFADVLALYLTLPVNDLRDPNILRTFILGLVSHTAAIDAVRAQRDASKAQSLLGSSAKLKLTQREDTSGSMLRPLSALHTQHAPPSSWKEYPEAVTKQLAKADAAAAAAAAARGAKPDELYES